MKFWRGADGVIHGRFIGPEIHIDQRTGHGMRRVKAVPRVGYVEIVSQMDSGQYTSVKVFPLTD